MLLLVVLNKKTSRTLDPTAAWCSRCMRAPGGKFLACFYNTFFKVWSRTDGRFNEFGVSGIFLTNTYRFHFMSPRVNI